MSRTTGIMTVYAVYIFECLMFLRRNQNLFHNIQNNNRVTRADNYNYPVHHLHITETSPQYMCVKLYNKLPVQIKRIDSQRFFKIKIKKMLIQLEPYSINDYLNM